jgi:tetratricopeptide (TPR) repeat protein
MSNFETGWIFLNLGDYHRARECLQQSLTVFRGERRYQSFDFDRVGHLSVRTHTLMVTCLGELGAFAEGVAYADEALQTAEAIDHPFERLTVYLPVGQFHVRQGTLHRAIPLLERAVALSQDAGPNFYHTATASLALAYALAGRTMDALAIVGQVVGNTGSRPLICGEAYLRAGDVEEAHRLVGCGLENVRHRKMRGNEACALWLLGEIAMHRDPPDVTPAAVHYQQALTLAEALGMRPLQAHCHFGLGTLYTKSDQREQARAELSAAIELYHAMAMTFWLPQAEATLAQVEGR